MFCFLQVLLEFFDVGLIRESFGAQAGKALFHFGENRIHFLGNTGVDAADEGIDIRLERGEFLITVMFQVVLDVRETSVDVCKFILHSPIHVC